MNVLYETYVGMEMDYSPPLRHHGIKGQKWGVRRYQNPDGTLTAEGRRHLQESIDPNIDDSSVNNATAALKERNKAVRDRQQYIENLYGTKELATRLNDEVNFLEHESGPRAAKIAREMIKEDMERVSKDRRLFYGSSAYWFAEDSLSRNDETYKSLISKSESASKHFNEVCKDLAKKEILKSSSSSDPKISKLARSADDYDVYTLSNAIADKAYERLRSEDERSVKHYESFTATNYLAHHGIKGMKWGVRRFQNQDGTWTDAGKRRRSIMEGASNKIAEFRKARTDRAAERAERREVKRAERAERKAEKRAEEKAKAIANGDAAGVMKYRSEMTDQELQSALNRINMVNKISDIQDSSMLERGEKALNRIAAFGNALTNVSKARTGWIEAKNSRNEAINKLRNFKDKSEADKYNAEASKYEAKNKLEKALREAANPFKKKTDEYNNEAAMYEAKNKLEKAKGEPDKDKASAAYEKGLEKAANAAATEARAKAKKDNKSFLEQERAARKAYDDFYKASKASGSSDNSNSNSSDNSNNNSSNNSNNNSSNNSNNNSTNNSNSNSIRATVNRVNAKISHWTENKMTMSDVLKESEQYKNTQIWRRVKKSPYTGNALRTKIYELNARANPTPSTRRKANST